MAFQYSDGEKEVQKHAGVEYQAGRLTGMVKDFVAPNGQQFILNQSFLIISSVDESGAIWTSIIKGKKRGFVEFLETKTINIRIANIDFNDNDILYKNIKTNPNVGILFIEFANRRRFRINGLMGINKDVMTLEIQQAFPNCPKYIQARHFIEKSREQVISQPQELELSTIRKIVKKADTFLMGTQGRDGGVDCSHRGGHKGFLNFTEEDTIQVPDYYGNNMFTSLGNIVENPNVGLLFVGFETGATLQLTGKAWLELDEEDKANGIDRFWYFKIERNRYTENVFPANWSLPHFSPFNPDLK